MKIRFWNTARVRRPDRFVLPRMNLSVTGPQIAVMWWLQITMVMLTVGSIGLAAWEWSDSVTQVVTAEKIEAATTGLQAANVQLSRTLAEEGFTLTGVQLIGIKQQIAFANQLSAKRGLSWAALLSDLEEATPAHISYSSIQMNFKDATVTLQGATASLQDLHALVEGLNGHPAFSKATLSSHVLQAPKGDGESDSVNDLSRGVPAVKQVLFDMTAIYKPEP